MPPITRDEIRRVVGLARLRLEEAEVDQMAVELDAILGYAETLARVDTEGVEPTFHVVPLATPLREDRAQPPMDPELAVSNAPERAGTAFVVPKVIDGEETG
jgi:aspartyl-tRNA(Asn)/glutamyl-tRNA(Gln) amidotransferase subunit C